MKARTLLPFACLVALLAFAGPAAARIIHVHHGQSIQSAIDSAKPGDTILVGPGQYHENLTITTDHLTLRGTSGRSHHDRAAVAKPGSRTVLEPASTPVESVCTDGGEVNGICAAGAFDQSGNPGRPLHGVKISGFVVRGFSGFGILLFNVHNASVRQTTAHHNDSYGISGFVLSGVRFTHNVAHHNGEPGFYIGDSPDADAVVKRNVSFQNGVGGSEGFGFLFRDSSEGSVSGNRAWGNCVGFVFVDTGEDPAPAADWTARRNLALENNAACTGETNGPPPLSGVGIAGVGMDHLVLSRNRVIRNAPSGPSAFRGGIFIGSATAIGGADPTHNRITRNKARDNEPVDIFYDGSGSGNVFSRNRCDSSTPGSICH